MKNKFTLVTFLLLTGTLLNAQTEYGDGSKRLLADRSNMWITASSTWQPSDSSLYWYNQQNKNTLGVYSSYNTSTSLWDRGFIQYFEYDVNGNITLQVDSQLNPASYSYSKKESRNYNGNNQVTAITSKRWNIYINDWFNSRRYQYTYDTAGNSTLLLQENYDSTAAAWKSYERYIYIYHGDNLVDTTLDEYWVSNSWKSYRRYINTYDANGNKITELAENYNNGTMAWDKNYKTEYTYDANNRVLTKTNSNWNAGTSSWDPDSRETNTYNAAGKRTSYITEDWNTGTSSWQGEYKYTYTYNGNNWLTNFERQNWNTNLLVWGNSIRTAYTYDNAGYQTYYLSESWNTNTLAWENSYEQFYYYEASISGIEGLEKERLMVFPNPTNSPVVFVNADKNIAYEVYDMQGRLITQGKLQPGTNSVILNEAKGNYILKAGNSSTVLIKQ